MMMKNATLLGQSSLLGKAFAEIFMFPSTRAIVCGIMLSPRQPVDEVRRGVKN